LYHIPAAEITRYSYNTESTAFSNATYQVFICMRQGMFQQAEQHLTVNLKCLLQHEQTSILHLLVTAMFRDLWWILPY